VNVNRTATVVTWENGLKLNCAVFACNLNSTQGLIIDICLVIAVAVTDAYHTAIDTCCVCSPDLNSNVIKRLAGIDINNLNVKMQINTFFAFLNILANLFALDI